ncbi:MAG TPA: hypothetical protein VMZ06_17040 [Candidatus Bathyarchaeia archaeon]|nr:hypothetical protein [Candidatus Bathyarchaeia archaeon]
MRVLLFGDKATDIRDEFQKYPELELVLKDPDVVVCYGGDGTLLAAECQWPGVPKAPIRNSRRGNRCIEHPPAAVIERLARGELVETSYCKLECVVLRADQPEPAAVLTAMNEINVHMARINSALRFRMWIDDDAYKSGIEILGDGFVISTPFGSTAYFNHITRGLFHSGIGVAFKSTSEHTNHVIVPEDSAVRILITRGPGILTYDNSTEYTELFEGDELVARKHEKPAIVLTWAPMKHPSDEF